MNLEDKSYLVLSNMDQLSDKSFVEEVLRYLPYTTISYLESVFQECEKFYDAHGRYPDRHFLLNHHEDLFEERTERFSPDVASDFLQDIKNEYLKVKSQECISTGDFDSLQKTLTSIHSYTSQDTFELSDSFDAYRKMTELPSGILTGIPEIDDYCKGLSYGTPTVIGGGPGSCKTTMAISTTYNNSVKNSFNGVFLTLEIMKRDWWFSLIARHSLEIGNPISARDMKKALLSEEEEEKFQTTLKDLQENMEGKIKVLSATDLGKNITPMYLDGIWEKCDRELGGIDYIIVDYIQCFRYFTPPNTSVLDFLNQMTSYFRILFTSYKDRGLIGVLLSQLNRDGIRKLERRGKGDLTLFSEINELERAAHNAIVLHASENDTLSNQVRAAIVKNRTGPVQEQLFPTYVDPDHFLVGSANFTDVFNVDSTELLSEDSDEGDLFG